MRRAFCLLVLITIALFVACEEEPAGPPTGNDNQTGPKPSAQITLPVPPAIAQMPPVFPIEWTPSDDAVEIRRILVDAAQFGGGWAFAIEYIRSHPNAPEWSEWIAVDAPDGSGRAWTTPPLATGPYAFAVQAHSGSGVVSDNFEVGRDVARILVTDSPPEPIVTFRPFACAPTVNDIALEVPSGSSEPICFSADASHYGAVVMQYRYGFDIVDLLDDSQWGEWTPYVGPSECIQMPTYFFGTHQLFLQVMDHVGGVAGGSVILNVIAFSMEKDVLLVDDWPENSSGWQATNGADPSDAEHDQFWADMLSDVAGFNPATDAVDLSTLTVEVPLSTMVQYKSIIWIAQGGELSSPSWLANLIRFRNPNIPAPPDNWACNPLLLYMAAGGKVLLVGDRVMTLVVNKGEFPGDLPAFPIIFRYELGGLQDGVYDAQEIGVRGVGERSFAYRDVCLNVLDVVRSQHPLGVRRPGVHACPVTGLRDHDLRTEGLRACTPIDNVTGGGFPRLDLRPEAAAPGRAHDLNGSGLNCDVYNPPYFGQVTPCDRFVEYGRRCFEPIYGLESLDTQSYIYDAPVAFWTGVYADRVPEVSGVAARSAVWGFHAVYFEPEQVKAALDIILFDEWKLTRK